MARYERDFMGRVRGMLDRISDHWREDDDRAPRRMQGGPRQGRSPMPASGPGGEGYFLSPQMARNAAYDMDYEDDGADRGRRGGMAQFGSAGAGRGYGGDFRTERGGRDAGEFFVNRGRAGGTGYRADYERDLGMRGVRGVEAGGYDVDYRRGGQSAGNGRAAPRRRRS